MAETKNFNSHAHVERDVEVKVLDPINPISTHTLTWSVTIKFHGSYEKWKNFNSHAHVERDNLTQKLKRLCLNFNSHAHVERDRPQHGYSQETVYFNSHAHVERDT